MLYLNEIKMPKLAVQLPPDKSLLGDFSPVMNLWVRYLRSKIFRPKGFLDIKTNRNREGVRRPNFT